MQMITLCGKTVVILLVLMVLLWLYLEIKRVKKIYPKVILCLFTITIWSFFISVSYCSLKFQHLVYHQKSTYIRLDSLCAQKRYDAFRGAVEYYNNLKEKSHLEKSLALNRYLSQISEKNKQRVELDINFFPSGVYVPIFVAVNTIFIFIMYILEKKTTTSIFTLRVTLFSLYFVIFIPFVIFRYWDNTYMAFGRKIDTIFLKFDQIDKGNNQEEIERTFDEYRKIIEKPTRAPHDN